LAHCFLFEIDGLLASKRKATFARYMDDIDIGVNTVSEGKEILRDLDLALQTRQLRLNSGKTRILDEKEARAHFRIRENAFLNRLEDRIKARQRSGASIARHQRFIGDSIEVGLRKGHFDGGNGEKIIKRLVNYARQFKVAISQAAIEELLFRWPGLRSAVLQWWLHSPTPASDLSILRKFVESGELIDHSCLIELAKAIVSARLPNTSQVGDDLREICRHLDDRLPWGFYSKMWILSKYGTTSELMNIVESRVTLWATQEHMARLVAGMYPRFLPHPYHSKMEAIIARTGSAGARDVWSFHDELASKVTGYTAVQAFVSKPNPSLPNRITHAKFLMVLSLLGNPTIAPIAVGHLRKAHASALSDEYYTKLAP
jgi:hypothetical protein